MRRRKYAVTTTNEDHPYSTSSRGGVVVKVERRGWFRRPSKERTVYGKQRPIPEVYSGSSYSVRYDAPTDTQIKAAAWELAAEIEFPKPKLEWCKTECKTL